MGYTTEFKGAFQLSQPATTEQIAYINEFSNSRRMARNVAVLQQLYQGKHGLNGNYGKQGEYFAFPGDNFGQNNDASILDYNTPPNTQPGLWCKWELNDEGTELQWDGGEKFYDYPEWVRYLIDNFFMPWGILLNGEILWQGEDISDRGLLIVENNCVRTETLR